MDEQIYIVGGGPSLRGFDFSKLQNKDTIAINAAIFDVPNPSYFITTDYTFINKMRKLKLIDAFKATKALKIFIADCHYPFMQAQDGKLIDTRYNLTYYLANYWKIIKAYKDHGIGYTIDDFRTGLNSGYCALQLAILLGYKKIYLLGFDLTPQEETHYHSLYTSKTNTFNEKLQIYLEYFKEGLTQIRNDNVDTEVISCSPISSLNTIIKYVPFKQL